MEFFRFFVCTLILAFFAHGVMQNMPRRKASRIRTRGVRWWSLYNRDLSSLRARIPDEENPPWMVNDNGGTTPTMRFFTKRQKRMVLQNPGVIFAIAKAASVAVAECQYQFHSSRWNCPTVTSSGPSIFGKILRKGIRETSFIYAITSAALSHTLARACAEGSIHTCRCNMKQSPHKNLFRYPKGGSMLNSVVRPQQVTQWQGCSDDIKFAVKFSRRFTDVADRGRDLRNIVNRHNNEVGRKVAFSEINQQCKCHGMSGSCTLKTCWAKLKPFREVSDKIKSAFDKSTKVIQKNGAHHPLQRNRQRSRLNHNLLPVDRHRRSSPHNRELVYFEDSPDFCRSDRMFSLSGTKGRQCNATGRGADSCHRMCCRRGYETKVYVERVRCNCKFIWCCKVKCQTCTKRVHRHTCL